MNALSFLSFMCWLTRCAARFSCSHFNVMRYKLPFLQTKPLLNWNWSYVVWSYLRVCTITHLDYSLVFVIKLAIKDSKKWFCWITRETEKNDLITILWFVTCNKLIRHLLVTCNTTHAQLYVVILVELWSSLLEFFCNLGPPRLNEQKTRVTCSNEEKTRVEEGRWSAAVVQRWYRRLHFPALGVASWFFFAFWPQLFKGWISLSTG